MANTESNAPTNEIRIVLLGKTGTGKSKTGNTILGGANNFVFGNEANSVTKKCSWQTSNRFGDKIDVVDTPGVFDTHKCNVDVQKEIARCITLTSPGPQTILLCVKMGRFTEEDLDTIKHFMKYFGEKLLKFTIVVFTHIDQWEQGYTERKMEPPSIETYMQNLPESLMKFITICGNRVLFVNNRHQGADRDNTARRIIATIKSLIIANENECYTNAIYGKVEEALEEKTRMSDQSRDEVKTSSGFFGYAKNLIELEVYAIKLF